MVENEHQNRTKDLIRRNQIILQKGQNATATQNVLKNISTILRMFQIISTLNLNKRNANKQDKETHETH